MIPYAYLSGLAVVISCQTSMLSSPTRTGIFQSSDFRPRIAVPAERPKCKSQRCLTRSQEVRLDNSQPQNRALAAVDQSKPTAARPASANLPLVKIDVVSDARFRRHFLSCTAKLPKSSGASAKALDLLCLRIGIAARDVVLGFRRRLHPQSISTWLCMI